MLESARDGAAVVPEQTRLGLDAVHAGNVLGGAVGNNAAGARDTLLADPATASIVFQQTLNLSESDRKTVLAKAFVEVETRAAVPFVAAYKLTRPSHRPANLKRL